MAKDLLLEIGLEEVPARFVRGAMNQLKEKAAKWLETSRIAHGEIEAYGTPRRIAILVRGVEEKQADVNEEVKGPSRKIAQNEQGEWSKAALGFARSQGVEPSDFFFKEVGGVEYIYANKSSIGTVTADVLPEGLTTLITSMSFPKNMRWGNYDLRFVRPIKWLVALFGEEIVPMEITAVQSGRTSRGHRFLGAETDIPAPADYVSRLKEQHVIVDVAERESLIVGQINALSAEKNWHIAIKEDLLEEVVFLVEYPNALFGTFDESFLNIPQEVLITSMREHQRYFPVLDGSGKLLPFFVTVRNGDRTSIENVAKGNEKVLRARLSDAKFFYAEDQKLAINDALAKLDSIVYHEELGTVADKVRRIVATTGKLTAALGLDKQASEDAARSAAICKFDLVTQMVYEFPELQGIMGEDYARKAGERETVAKAINEHYQPRFAGDRAPASIVGAIVSLADKIDTIVGCFSIGIIPTGSQDPYALRRQAAGIVQIVLAHGMKLPLHTLFDLALDVHSARGLKRNVDEVRKDLYEFFGLRVKNVLAEQSIRYDVVDAVMAVGYNDLRQTVDRAAAVTAAAAGDRREEFKTVVDALGRVCNLAAKAASNEVNPQLFADDSEGVLYRAWQSVSDRVNERVEQGDAAAAISELAGLKAPINAYFDRVMVMAEDEAVRKNRLATLASIAGSVNRIADFSKLVW
ncbi:glycine--tRNA ligase subunit beta [Paenibacillus sacheonensis]|uniref:Glycine--tRNA ligase beta subunit n=1 Tax=Paenibacillus sacheonensis TaxID=742054 RepID=A0A7X4YTL6_9BACL|nr:glycine--tRNA ligase subunit beta [Paenibacillus sacheonensis]MBM7565659.1 glycyl-tRNA synthetase beta chain [Paenibacillus sacheonensis]NBC72283.1 glycine--tRNA ligase subunit beta [Paenibacillus sacheonensis]